jgi:hypothetical protein
MKYTIRLVLEGGHKTINFTVCTRKSPEEVANILRRGLANSSSQFTEGNYDLKTKAMSL